MKAYYFLILAIFFICIFYGCSKDNPLAYNPVVGNVTVIQVTATTAICEVDILFESGATITEKGVCWDTSANTTLADFRTTEGGGKDDFQTTLTGLDSSTRYFVRGYAINSAGIGYGAVKIFATPPYSKPIVIEASGFASRALSEDNTYVSWPTIDGFHLVKDAGFVGPDPSGSLNGVPRQHDSTFDQYKTISSWGFHTLGLKEDGTLWAWGYNDSGQLGDGTFIYKASAVQVDSDYIAIAAGANFSLGIKADGTLWGWGANGLGQAGLGTSTTASHTPTQIGADFKIISAGNQHALGIKNDNTLWAWGRNLHGQIGDGSQDSVYIPKKIGDDFIAVDAGGQHSLAMKADGTLYGWGLNNFGQLGDGTLEFQNRPYAITTDFVLFAAGDIHSLGVKADGSLWGWGVSNFYVDFSGNVSGNSNPIPIRLYLE